MVTSYDDIWWKSDEASKILNRIVLQKLPTYPAHGTSISTNLRYIDTLPTLANWISTLTINPYKLEIKQNDFIFCRQERLLNRGSCIFWSIIDL